MKRELILAAMMMAVPAASMATETAAATQGQEQAGDQSATEFVRSQTDVVLSIVNAAFVDPSTVAARRAELTARLREFLSYELLARRTLGAHWDGLSSDDQAIFVGLLRDLIEASYSRSLGKGSVDNSEYSVEFLSERSRRDLSTVEAKVTIGTTEHHIEVKLQRSEGGLMVYDLVTDDVSLEESYAESFDSIIRDQGWDGLVERMRTRLAEIRAEL